MSKVYLGELRSKIVAGGGGGGGGQMVWHYRPFTRKSEGESVLVECNQWLGLMTGCEKTTTAAI